jgi:hypothetical protein
MIFSTHLYARWGLLFRGSPDILSRRRAGFKTGTSEHLDETRKRAMRPPFVGDAQPADSPIVRRSS